MKLELQKFTYITLFVFLSCYSDDTEQNFTFKEGSQGVEVMENGQPVFFYQRKSKSLDGRYICSNYIHPLYSLNGDTLTEEFPADHPYHRGVFWAWHQMYVNGKSVGDGWIMSNIEQEVTDLEVVKNPKAGQLKIESCWKSNLYENGKPFLAEETNITIYPRQKTYRIIDFSIALKALVSGVEIGGSEDEKGYGGFCARIKSPEKLKFTSISGDILPQNLQIEAGTWMDFTGSLGKNEEINGIAILCHPETPNYEAPWILRNQTSMQNVVFPGRYRITVPIERSITLYYRMIIHNGDTKSMNIEKFQSEYQQMSFR